jgi:hypothetical protein
MQHILLASQRSYVLQHITGLSLIDAGRTWAIPRRVALN